MQGCSSKYEGKVGEGRRMNKQEGDLKIAPSHGTCTGKRQRGLHVCVCVSVKNFLRPATSTETSPLGNHCQNWGLGFGSLKKLAINYATTCCDNLSSMDKK